MAIIAVGILLTEYPPQIPAGAIRAPGSHQKMGQKVLFRANMRVSVLQQVQQIAPLDLVVVWSSRSQQLPFTGKLPK